MFDFVTNSSSASNTILVAKRKGKGLKEIFSRVGIPASYTSYFSDCSKNDKVWIEELQEEEEIEIDHLKNDYDFIVGEFLIANWGDDKNIEYPENEEKFYSILDCLEKERTGDIIVIYAEEGP